MSPVGRGGHEAAGVHCTFRRCNGVAAGGKRAAVRAQTADWCTAQNAESDLLARRYRTIFEQSLDKLGWTVGKNLLIDYRSSNSGPDEAKAAVTELLSLSPDLILANSLSAVRAAQQATRSVPIVFTAVSEPVVQGFVKSLAHPGENITGFTKLEPSVAGKWLALLKEVAPRVTRVALIMNPASGPVTQLFYRAIETAAPSTGVETTLIKVYDLADIHMAMSRIGGQSGTGIIVPPDTFLGFTTKRSLNWRPGSRCPQSLHLATIPSRAACCLMAPT
jgi:putative ABC transport system substrate-binding protein